MVNISARQRMGVRWFSWRNLWFSSILVIAVRQILKNQEDPHGQNKNDSASC